MKIDRLIGILSILLPKDVPQTVTFICKEYGISMYLLIMRASQANVISSPVAQSFYIKAGKAGWRTNEPSRIDGERPMLFEQLVFRAINEEEITIQKGVELL